MDVEYLGRMVSHPNRPQVEGVVADLIHKVRAVDGPADTYDVQRELLGYIVGAEKRYNEAERARRRRRETLDWDVEFWRRTTRQFRSVGDAIAWKFLGYRRKWILLLGRNPPPGHLLIKSGSQAEVIEFDQNWRSGQPALLTGLTNCITIGDILRARADEGAMEIVEVKPSGQKIPKAQMATINRALREINAAESRLEGTDGAHYFVESPIRQRSHWSTAQESIDRASELGVACWSPARGVAVRFVSVAGSAMWPRDVLTERFASEQQTIAPAMTGTTQKTRTDLAALPYRSARSVPMALFPIRVADSASLMTGSLLATVELSIDVMADALREKGLESAIALPDEDGVLTGVQPILRWRQGRERGTVHANVIEQLAIELLPFPVMAEVMASRTRPGPEAKVGVFVCLSGEADVWA